MKETNYIILNDSTIDFKSETNEKVDPISLSKKLQHLILK